MYIPGDPVTTRDEQIVSSLVTSALPFMLLHQSEWSNLTDLMRIAKGLKGHVGTQIDGVVECIKRLKEKEKSGPESELVERFLANLDDYMPRYVLERLEGKDIISRLHSRWEQNLEKERSHRAEKIYRGIVYRVMTSYVIVSLVILLICGVVS